MRIGIYRRKNIEHDKEFIFSAIQILKERKVEMVIHDHLYFDPFFSELLSDCPRFKTFADLEQLPSLDFLFSFGGDGSFIDAAKIVRHLKIPIVGVNTGRIGFLTSITKRNFEHYIQLLEQKKYRLEERSLLQIKLEPDLETIERHALNDITLRASDDTSIQGVEVWLNDERVNTYWADCLIIATPTGSTAYSLSCGGAILHPSSKVHIITPIASHSLSARPIVVNDSDIIKLKVHSRSNQFVLGIDTFRRVLKNPVEMMVKKGDFSITSVRFPSADYFSVIREKLMWGIDLRNMEQFG